jgi:NADPH2 dehydrogenase
VNKLIEPLLVGCITLKNRLGLGPINPGFSHLSRQALSQILEFYSAYARGQVGTVYIGGIAVSHDGRSNSHSLVMNDTLTRRLVEGIAAKITSRDAVLAIQLMHSGRQASSIEIQAETIAASAMAGKYYVGVPRQATRADLRTVVRAFAQAASAAVTAGAQLVEIHAAHGYLISGFLSRASNQRSDEYGGSVRNRFRLLREVLDAVRLVTDSSAVGIRINVYESEKFGLTVPELIEGLGELVSLVDFVSVTAGMYAVTGDVIIPPRSLGPALWRRQARTLKGALRVPVFLAGNITSPELAERVLTEDDADLILMVRSLLADPNLFTKYLNGYGDTIQPCTELYLCKYHSRRASNVYCPHNPTLRTAQLLPKVARTLGHDSTENRS